MSTVPRIAARRHAASPRRWVSEELFDFWGTRLHPLWTLRRPLARLVSRTAESADAVTLVLTPNRHFRGLLPGQHVTGHYRQGDCRRRGQPASGRCRGDR